MTERGPFSDLHRCPRVASAEPAEGAVLISPVLRVAEPDTEATKSDTSRSAVMYQSRHPRLLNVRFAFVWLVVLRSSVPSRRMMATNP
jgi:hypothetical protein